MTTHDDFTYSVATTTSDDIAPVLTLVATVRPGQSHDIAWHQALAASRGGTA